MFFSVDLYFSPNIVRVNKSRIQMGKACSTNDERSDAYRVLVGKREGRDYLEDRGVDGRIIIKWIFEKWDGARTGSIWIGIR